MSQQQPIRPQTDYEKPIKYGDVLPVSGKLASEAVAPQDAATMQAAENKVLGKTQRGGPAAVMQSAAAKNESAGFVSHDDATLVPRYEGVTMSEVEVGGRCIIKEVIGGQVHLPLSVVGQYTRPATVPMRSQASALYGDAITVGEALEATALSAGDKPVEQSDAAAIQAAEVRAAGITRNAPAGLAATAQSAAALNARTMADENKTKLSDILADATSRLPGDKAATREDAERVIDAEIRNNPRLSTHPGGVGASVAAAARLNQEK